MSSLMVGCLSCSQKIEIWKRRVFFQGDDLVIIFGKTMQRLVEPGAYFFSRIKGTVALEKNPLRVWGTESADRQCKVLIMLYCRGW
jgi:hypothetical protein